MTLSDIFLTASANMGRSKLRTGLTIIAIFVGALTISLTTGIGAGVSAYIDQQLGNLGSNNVLTVRPADEGNGPPIATSEPRKYDPDQNVTGGGEFGTSQQVLTPDDVETIRNQPGIESAEPNLSVALDYIEGKNSEKYQISVSAFIDGTELDLAVGNALSNDTDRYEIIIPIAYVTVLGFTTPEDAINVPVTLAVTDATDVQHTLEATIVGIQDQALVGSNGASIGQPLVEALYELQSEGLPDATRDRYQSVAARVDPNLSEQEFQTLKDELSEQGYEAMTVDDQIGIFKQVLDAIIIVLNVFGGIALLAASFGIINTLYMAVQERTREIGLMKAMGMSSIKVFLLFSIEAILIGFWGSLLGVAVAVGVGQVVNSVASETFLQDLTGFNLMAFPVLSMGVIMLVIMGIAFLAGTFPARRAAQQNPISALRYE